MEKVCAGLGWILTKESQSRKFAPELGYGMYSGENLLTNAETGCDRTRARHRSVELVCPGFVLDNIPEEASEGGV